MKYDITKLSAPQMPSLQKAQNSANYSSKRPQKHARIAFFDAFPYTWRTCEWFGISVSRPHLEGLSWLNG